MKRNICVAAILVALLFLLGGCGFWMDGEYVSVEPYQQEAFGIEQKIMKVSTHSQMRNALLTMVEEGTKSGVLDVSEFEGGSVLVYMNTSVRNILNTNPIGAYAVESVDYELGTNAGREALAVEIAYRYDRTHMLRIEQVEGMEQAFSAVEDALENAEPSVVLRVREYEKTDFVQWVKDQSALRPDIVMEVPSVQASVYPDKGSDRIVELLFTYQTSRESLQQMQQKVEPVFTAAELYVRNATQVREKYAQLYSFLMERSDYKVETSITPAYSLLVHGVGDCRSFANVYAAMCRKAGVDCFVVSGTCDGEPWTWNIIYFRGAYYHLDLLRSSENGAFSPQKSSAMSGYVWDYSAYPD